MNRVFFDRRHAGQLLAERLTPLLSVEDCRQGIVLALARGGVPVGFEIAKSLELPLEVLIVRKIGHPLQPEYGIGAITEDGIYWLNDKAAGYAAIPKEQIQEIIENEKLEIKRLIAYYRENRALSSLQGKTVILVDDGLATGATAKAAIQFIKGQGAQKIVLAVPVAAGATLEKLKPTVDRIIYISTSSTQVKVGNYFQNFERVTDDDVKQLLKGELELTHPIEGRIEKNSVPIKNRYSLGGLLDKIGQSKIVMLGEASHGTQEFYEWRRVISEELIEKHGFNFIAVEGDWPPCAELNRFIHSEINDSDAREREMLKHFKRWPTWMWANTEIFKLSEWMHLYNLESPTGKQAGFFGLDVYSLFESVDEVNKQLMKISPVLAKEVALRYRCFKRFLSETAYAKSLFQFPEGCEQQVLKALQSLLEIRLDGIRRDELFDAQQNAHVVKNAEHYYRNMIYNSDECWNIRDSHMIETLERLLAHYGTHSKAIVWAHNTHIGDYRATDMARAGQINIGGLAREKWGEENVSLIGFGTYQGEVIASHAWDGPIEVMDVPAAKPDSYEAYFHTVAQRTNSNAFYVWLKEELKNSELSEVHGHRAIGVVYDPHFERHGNYVPTSLSHRYDGFIFIDKTKALTPLVQKFTHREIPETWPAGL